MYVIEGTEYNNPVFVFAELDQAEKANRQISMTKGLDMKATTRWDNPKNVDGLWCITHPITEGEEFVSRVVEYVDDVLMVADLQTVGEGEEQVQTLGQEAIAISAILKAKLECEARIYAGFDSECLGEVKHFDCEDHDQNTVAGLSITALLGLQGLTTEECHWKGTGELLCYKFEYAQILQLAVDMKKHVQAQIDQFNAERLAILNA